MVESIGAAAGAELSKSEQSRQKLADDMDHFMNLLVTQLKNQDPLEPMDPNEFTSQLVQFASVEQQIQGNANMEKLVELQQQTQLATVVGYVDKTVEAKGDALILEDGSATSSYTLDQSAKKTVINVLDPSGKSVFTTTGETGAGRHNFTWNGLNNQGYAEDPGVYTVVVSPIDQDGIALDVEQTFKGRVTGVSMDGGEAYLHFDDAAVSMDDLVSVESSDKLTVN
jgi:flagellar basal-body rod modification protein FlgD